jgi:hypothetical protein
LSVCCLTLNHSSLQSPSFGYHHSTQCCLQTLVGVLVSCWSHSVLHWQQREQSSVWVLESLWLSMTPVLIITLVLTLNKALNICFRFLICKLGLQWHTLKLYWKNTVVITYSTLERL